MNCQHLLMSKPEYTSLSEDTLDKKVLSLKYEILQVMSPRHYTRREESRQQSSNN